MNWIKAYQNIFDIIHRQIWPMEKIVADVEAINDFERNCEIWEIEWKNSLLSKEERKKVFDITSEEAFEARRQYLFSEIENVTRIYYQAIQQKVSFELLRELAKKRVQMQLRYFFFTYKPKENKSFTERELEQARNVQMEKLIETKKGFALCPFHKEKTASFRIFNNLWYCFGACGQGGDVIKFVEKLYGYTFYEAVDYLLKL